MLLSHESPEPMSSSSSECLPSPVATPTTLRKPTRDMSFQELNDLFEDNCRRAMQFHKTSRQTSTPKTTGSFTPGNFLRTLVTLTVVLFPLAICLHSKFATFWFRGARANSSPNNGAVLGRDSTLGWSHKPVVSPSCRVARKYTINPGTPAVASWIMDCEVPGFGATADGNHHRIVDAVKTLSPIPDELFQAQILVHQFRHKLRALTVEAELTTHSRYIAGSTIDLLGDAMFSYYFHIHNMLCSMRDLSTDTLHSKAREAPYTLSWYNNKVKADVKDNISALEKLATIIRGRHTECQELMWNNHIPFGFDVLPSDVAWGLFDDVHELSDEALEILDKIDEDIKNTIEILQAIKHDITSLKPDLRETDAVGLVQISNLLDDVEETSKLSSDLIVRMEELWQNSTFNR
ncbi:hypothetical protein KCU65_g5775, partial [Aureobasidium melanogenum]